MRIEVHLAAREKALAKGDHGQVRAIDADLRRVGYPVETPLSVETDMIAATATAPRRKTPRNRCEHDAVPDRCIDCNPELEGK